MNRRPVALAAALLLDVVGAGGALLVAARTWQTISTPAGARTDVLAVDGRAVDPASTALALVALAGVVAILATRGVWRRVVGVLVALAGAGLVWRAAVSTAALPLARARSLVEDRHRTVSAAGVVPQVVTHPLWPALSLACGVLVLVAGGFVAWRGPRWSVLSSRYEAPGPSPVSPAAPAADRSTDTDPEQERRRAATALWSALDRGEDPTR